jgi:predicted membrane protein
MNLRDLPRGSIFALLLIVAGAVLFLDNVGVLPIPDIQAYWPIFIVFWGATMLERWRHPVSVIWGLALMAWGVLLTLGNLHILPVHGGVFWPIALIAGGVTMLVRPVDFSGWNQKVREMHEQHAQRRTDFSAWRDKRRTEVRDWHEKMRSRAGTSGAFSMGGRNFFGNRLRETIVFGSVNRRVQTQQFEGGKVDVVFGSVELDFTEAAISCPDHTAVLDVNAVFGGVEIAVPRNWKVVMKTAAVLGGCDDRTIPPRPEPGVETQTMVVTGAAVFGGIEIRN